MPPPTPSPPPAYETVAKLNEKDYDIPEKFSISTANDGRDDKIMLEDDDLPTYDDAMKLGAQGYL